MTLQSLHPILRWFLLVLAAIPCRDGRFFSMTLASLILVIIRDICEIRGQILQPLISRMTRIMRTEHFHPLMLRLQHRLIC